MPIAVDALLLRMFGDPRQPLALDCERWLKTSRRFRAFAETYQGKIRKKVSNVQDGEARRDLYCELETAYLLLHAREFTVEYEQYAQGKQRGPDFSVVYKTHTQFNVEVKRLRVSSGDPAVGETSIQAKLINSVCDKLGQLPPSVINVLAVVADGQTFATGDLASAMSMLKERAVLRDDPYFVRRGFLGSRDYVRHAQRLSAVLLRGSSGNPLSRSTVLWTNPEARHPLSRELATLLVRCAMQPVPS